MIQLRIISRKRKLTFRIILKVIKVYVKGGFAILYNNFLNDSDSETSFPW